jgi:hypothetical protein
MRDWCLAAENVTLRAYPIPEAQIDFHRLTHSEFNRPRHDYCGTCITQFRSNCK